MEPVFITAYLWAQLNLICTLKSYFFNKELVHVKGPV
jgi:hypothetical protein